MTRDELYPIIDEVLHRRLRPYEYAGSYWIDDYAELRIHELAETLCDVIVGRLAGAVTTLDGVLAEHLRRQKEESNDA